MIDKIQPHHLERKAVLYVRQSSPHQVAHNRESRALQYAMKDRLRALGAHVHETDRHFHQSDHLRFNHSKHFARVTAGPAPWGGACRWRLT